MSKTNKKPQPTFGEAEWLIKNFDDVDTAVKCSKTSKEYLKIKSAFDAVISEKTGGNVYAVFRTKGMFDCKKCAHNIAHLTLGLNGPGKQSDYLTAIAKLTKSGEFQVLASLVDAADDLWDFLVWYK